MSFKPKINSASSYRLWCTAAALVVFLTGILVYVNCNEVRAQEPTAKIGGVVEDPQGSIVPEVTLKVTNTQTNVTKTAVTNDLGYYEVIGLAPGSYQVEAERPGFKRFVQRGVVLQVEQQARLDVTLKVGELAETIEVVEPAPLLEAGSSSIGQVVSRREVADLPLNGRNPFDLVLITAGVTPTEGFSSFGLPGQISGPVASSFINGGRQGTTEVFLDGSPNTFAANMPGTLGVAYIPSVDSVEEFKVITNNMAAEHGYGVGLVNLVTRSGTNEFHGSFFEFFRNSVLNANNFFANRDGLPRGSFKSNQFGGTFGGPLLRQTTFFFVDYDGTRQSRQSVATLTVPTPDMRRGDFSALLGPQLRDAASNPLFDRQGRPILAGQIYDPCPRLEPDGTCASQPFREPFPNNIIPSDRLNPTALAVLRFLPLPNRPGLAQNFASSGADRLRNDQFDVRIDHMASDRQKIFARFSFARTLSTPSNPYGNIANPSNFPSLVGARQFIATDDYTFNPTTLLTTSYSFSRNTSVAQIRGGDFHLTDIRQPKVLDDQVLFRQFPRFTFSEYSSIGPANVFTAQRQFADRHSLAGAISKMKGRHSLKIGYQMSVFRMNEGTPCCPTGSYSFQPGFTLGPDATTGRGGNSLATFLLGAVTMGSISQDVFRATQSVYHALYAQDDLRVTRKLTFNLGLRYDIALPYTERYNRATYFDINAPSPVQIPSGAIEDVLNGAAQRGISLQPTDLASLIMLRGGERFAGRDGRRVFVTNKKNLAPRFGFAYQAAAKTVVRGGFGVFFGPSLVSATGTSGPFNIDGFGTIQNMVSSLDNGVTPANRLDDPFRQGLVTLRGSARGLLTLFGQPAISVEHKLSDPYSLHWNFGIQQELPGGFLVAPSYVGSRAIGFVTGVVGTNFLNQLPIETIQRFGDALNASLPNPFRQLMTDPNSPVFDPTSPLRAESISLAMLLTRFPQFPGMFLTFSPANGQSTYHAFQLRVEKRFSQGLSLLLSYTNSKLLDNGEGSAFFLGQHANPQDNNNYRLEKSLASQDISQRLVASWTYNLPFGRGQRFLNTQNTLVDALIGGWQANGILTLARGIPLVFVMNDNSANRFIAALRPNLICDPTLSGSVNSRLNGYFNRNCLASPAPFTLGTASRTSPNVRAPGTRNLDLSLFRNIAVRERYRIQFRAEFFNVTNRPKFGPPVTAFGHPEFGLISSQVNDPRQIQFALKIHY